MPAAAPPGERRRKLKLTNKDSSKPKLKNELEKTRDPSLDGEHGLSKAGRATQNYAKAS